MLNRRRLLTACASVLLTAGGRAKADVTSPTLEEVRQAFERLTAASDGGDRSALVQFAGLYSSLYEQAFFEAGSNLPRTAAAMIPELDHWLRERADGGSATAQYWMGERSKLLRRYGVRPPEMAEVARWYRASAEQGFAPAQDSLGQVLGFFPELAREPFEAEKWLFRAVRQNEPAAAERLLEAIRIDAKRADYRPDDEIMAWLKQRADAGDATAISLVHMLSAPD